MYNLREYRDVYLKIFGSLWQYYRDGVALNNSDAITDFPANDNNNVSLKFKEKITTHIGNDSTKYVEMIGTFNISK